MDVSELGALRRGCWCGAWDFCSGRGCAWLRGFRECQLRAERGGGGASRCVLFVWLTQCDVWGNNGRLMSPAGKGSGGARLTDVQDDGGGRIQLKALS